MTFSFLLQPGVGLIHMLYGRFCDHHQQIHKDHPGVQTEAEEPGADTPKQAKNPGARRLPALVGRLHQHHTEQPRGTYRSADGSADGFIDQRPKPHSARECQPLPLQTVRRILLVLFFFLRESLLLSFYTFSNKILQLTILHPACSVMC